MPTVLYDDDCDFCKKWIRWLLSKTNGRVAYQPYQSRSPEFRHIPDSDLARAVHMVKDDGQVISGAEVFYQSLKTGRGRSVSFWFYRHIPPFRFVSKLGYRFIAGHRNLSAWVTWLLWGDEIASDGFTHARANFLRVLAVCYLSAFITMGVQVRGLIGAKGIFPAADTFLSQGGVHTIVEMVFFPTLAWVFNSDFALLATCVVGAAASVCLFVSTILETVVSFATWGGLVANAVCWLLYLSLINESNVFLSYQWESLLMEAGFLAFFLYSRKKKISLAEPEKPTPSRLTVFLFQWLLFRLLFSSGVSKLVSGDETWRSLTALKYHFETQPLPTWIAWYADFLPMWCLKTSTAGLFVIEIFVPFLFFAPRRVRNLACGLEIFLQILIFLTGNYTYFNILTIGLCFFLLDDRAFGFFKRRKKSESTPSTTRAASRSASRFARVVACFLIVVSLINVKSLFTQEHVLEQMLLPVLEITFNWHLVSAYGLFASMTTERDELMIEGSANGTDWLTYEFPYKPGDVMKRPQFVAPYQPRLDWQAWFAALGTFEDNPWLQNLVGRLLEGEPTVLALFKTNPFPDHPPRLIRIQLYQYKFADPETHRTTGAWWTRTLKSVYAPPMIATPEQHNEPNENQ